MSAEQSRYIGLDLSNNTPPPLEDPEDYDLMPPSMTYNAVLPSQDYSDIDNPPAYVPNRTAALEYNAGNEYVSDLEKGKYYDAITDAQSVLDTAILAPAETPRDELIDLYESARLKFLGASTFRNTLDPFSMLDLAFSMDRIIELDGVKPYETAPEDIDRVEQWKGISNQYYNLAWSIIAEQADAPEQVFTALVVAERLENVHNDPGQATKVLIEAKKTADASQSEKQMAEIIKRYVTSDRKVKREVARAAMHNLITSSHDIQVAA